MKNFLTNLSTSKKLAIAAGMLGIIALFIGNPVNENKIFVNAKELSLSTVKESDKVELQTLADWLIKGNADYTLVDLRNEKDYSEYNIPSSINIKMEDLLTSDLMRNQKIILYGDDDISSAQSWFILKSANYKGVYILSGGMSGWKNEILFPRLAFNASPEEVEAFEKIKQVSTYFGGSPQIAVSEGETTTTLDATPPMPVLPKLTAPPAGQKVKKKKKEGC